jgi:hypothetical protein
VNPRSWIRALFALAAVYDGVLGIVFLVVPAVPFRLFAVPPPNHMGYVRFPAALLVVFALMFLEIARDPARGRNLIPYGILLKASYCGVVFSYWILEGIPRMWKPFAIADLAFGTAFLAAYLRLGRTERAVSASPAGGTTP